MVSHENFCLEFRNTEIISYVTNTGEEIILIIIFIAAVKVYRCQKSCPIVHPLAVSEKFKVLKKNLQNTENV